MGDLASTTAHEGRLAEALPLLLENLETWHDFGDLRVVVWTLSEVADTYAGLGEQERAVTLAAAADALAAQAGIPFERWRREVRDHDPPHSLRRRASGRFCSAQR